jgi:hypothetical protein
MGKLKRPCNPIGGKNPMISTISDRRSIKPERRAFLGNFWETGYRVPENGRFVGVPKGAHTSVKNQSSSNAVGHFLLSPFLTRFWNECPTNEDR